MLDYLRHVDPLPRSVRRFQEQRDALIAQFSTAGEVPGEARIAQELVVSSRKYVMLSQNDRGSGATLDLWMNPQSPGS
jgi:hypothetical protein